MNRSKVFEDLDMLGTLYFDTILIQMSCIAVLYVCRDEDNNIILIYNTCGDNFPTWVAIKVSDKIDVVNMIESEESVYKILELIKGNRYIIRTIYNNTFEIEEIEETGDRIMLSKSIVLDSKDEELREFIERVKGEITEQ